MNRHPDLELVAGDDWSITATPLDATGAAVPVTGDPTFEWVLIGWDGEALDIQPTLSIAESNVVIAVSAEVTSNINPGRYHDALRIVSSSDPSKTTTVWGGAINVDADPLAVPDEDAS